MALAEAADLATPDQRAGLKKAPHPQHRARRSIAPLPGWTSSVPELGSGLAGPPVSHSEPIPTKRVPGCLDSLRQGRSSGLGLEPHGRRLYAVDRRGGIGSPLPSQLGWPTAAAPVTPSPVLVVYKRTLLPRQLLG